MADTQPLILVVDDESHIVHVLTLKLQNAGYTVMSAEDGEEAMELALQHTPALVITDFQMPILNGLDLCRKLKQHPTTQSVPAIMLTARGFTLSKDDMARTNIIGVLSKPFSPREVLSRVQELVGHHASQGA